MSFLLSVPSAIARGVFWVLKQIVLLVFHVTWGLVQIAWYIFVILTKVAVGFVVGFTIGIFLPYKEK